MKRRLLRTPQKPKKKWIELTFGVTYKDDEDSRKIWTSLNPDCLDKDRGGSSNCGLLRDYPERELHL